MMKIMKPESWKTLVSLFKNVRLPKYITLCLTTIIFFISFAAAIIFMLLPQQIVHGRPVPVLFRDRPTYYYHMLLISTLFAFVGSFSVLLKLHKPMIERVCGIIAVAFMLSALPIVLYAIAIYLWFRMNLAQLLEVMLGVCVFFVLLIFFIIMGFLFWKLI